MKVKLYFGVLLAVALFTVACSSNQFHLELSLAQTGLDYVAIDTGHVNAQTEINAAFAATGAVYDSWVAGTTTVDKVQGALTALAQQLTTITQAFGVNQKDVQLAQLAITQAISLVKLLPLGQPAVLHAAIKMPTASLAKSVSPTYLTPKEFREAFNATAGVKVIK